MVKKIQSMLFYAGTDYSSISRVVPRILQTNRIMMTIISVFATIFISIMLTFSFHTLGLMTNRPIYIFGLVSSAGFFV